MKKITLSLTLLLPILLVGLTSTGERYVQAVDDAEIRLVDAEFIGATRCRTCHRTEEQGEQFPIWEKSAHAGAFATLASDEAKSIAQGKGIADPQAATECLQCHVAAFDAPAERLGDRYDKAEGVTCESCHGAGGEYYRKATMEGISSGEIDPASVGLIKPDEALCRTCHNEKSPTFKGFDFEEFWAKIAHPVPAPAG